MLLILSLFIIAINYGFALKMLCLYLLTKIVYILLLNHIEAVNPTPVNIRNC